jgi:hypothetical protein
MSNPRDTGDNVKVDFVWGNVPMQPNDDRGENTLDPDLDNHIIVVAEYNGFPGYTPVPPFTDTVENGTVPNVVGSTESAANSALVAVGLVKGAVTSTPVGATTVNDAKVKAQSVAAGTVVNEGTAVALTLFAAPTVPDVLGDDEETAEAALVAAGLVKGTVTTSTDGATELNDETVKSTTPAAGVKANTGSAVALTLFDYVAPPAGTTFTAGAEYAELELMGEVVGDDRTIPELYPFNMTSQVQSDLLALNGVATTVMFTTNSGYTTPSPLAISGITDDGSGSVIIGLANPLTLPATSTDVTSFTLA